MDARDSRLELKTGLELKLGLEVRLDLEFGLKFELDPEFEIDFQPFKTKDQGLQELEGQR